MIYVGPAGNVGEARTTEESFYWLKKHGLNAQEIEFVRSIYLNEEKAKILGGLAKKLNIRLSIHAPYFINLASEKQKVINKSKEIIIKTAEIGEILMADSIAIHTAYYNKKNVKTTKELVIEGINQILMELQNKGVRKIKLGIETMAKESQYPSFEEVVELCKEIKHKQVVPYIDWAHIFCRNNGRINYGYIFDTLKKLGIKHINSHFEGLKYNNKLKKFVDVHEMINDNPPLKPLLMEVVKRKVNITIIAESKPWPEKDALKIKKELKKLNRANN